MTPKKHILLYKPDAALPARPLYWEAWEEAQGTIVHWGRVGEIGAGDLIPPAKTPYDELVARVRRAGYGDDVKTQPIIVQIPTAERMANANEIALRDRLHLLFDETLRQTGNGSCDGGDAGSGNMNLFIYAVDRDAAVAAIVRTLSTQRLLGTALVAVDDRNGQLPRVVSPLGYTRPFSVL